VDDVLDKHGGHLTTGIFGTKYMLNALTDAGRADVACTIVGQKDFPGWVHMLERGATTLWEHWEYSDDVYSHNHPMFGSVSEWFYRAVAGINVAEDAVGADKLIIRPNPVGGLTAASGEYQSIRGKVVCRWRIEEDRLWLDVRIPVGATAEGDRPAEQAPGVRLQQAGGERVVYKVGSGAYNFQVREYK
jgi:alpha-L-rhamnosidase